MVALYTAIMSCIVFSIKSDGWKHFPLLIRTDSKPQIDLPVIDAKATAINHVLNVSTYVVETSNRCSIAILCYHNFLIVACNCN